MLGLRVLGQEEGARNTLAGRTERPGSPQRFRPRPVPSAGRSSLFTVFRFLPRGNIHRALSPPASTLCSPPPSPRCQPLAVPRHIRHHPRRWRSSSLRCPRPPPQRRRPPAAHSHEWRLPATGEPRGTACGWRGRGPVAPGQQWEQSCVGTEFGPPTVLRNLHAYDVYTTVFRTCGGVVLVSGPATHGMAQLDPPSAMHPSARGTSLCVFDQLAGRISRRDVAACPACRPLRSTPSRDGNSYYVYQYRHSSRVLRLFKQFLYSKLFPVAIRDTLRNILYRLTRPANLSLETIASPPLAGRQPGGTRPCLGTRLSATCLSSLLPGVPTRSAAGGWLSQWRAAGATVLAGFRYSIWKIRLFKTNSLLALPPLVDPPSTLRKV